VVHRIFEPFFTTKEHGTGLGLALTQQIVSEHGGRITCRNEPTGGTSFVVWLPAPESAVAARSAGEPAQAATVLDPSRALV
jgi:signal transduction histidine kinase